MTSVLTFHRPRVELPAGFERMLPLLEPDERAVLTLRLGLDGHRPRTAWDVARTLHSTVTTVRLLEARAGSKLRHPSLRGASRA